MRAPERVLPNGHDIVVIGASSGGWRRCQGSPAAYRGKLPAAVFVVVHISEEAPSVLPKILDRSGPLEAVRAEDGERVEEGRVYVAPPGYHMMVEEGRVRMVRGPKENRHRPVVNPLFRSETVAYGPRVVGVVLTGPDGDGTAGLLAVKRRGGVTVVQDPEDALFARMPESALEHVDVDYCLPLAKIAPLLARLSREEGALYVALNTLEESVSMSRTLAVRVREHNQDQAASRFEERARRTGEQVDLIRRALSDGSPDSAGDIA